MVVKKWHRRLELLYYVCFFLLQCSEMYCACLVVTTVCFSSVLIPENDYHVRFCIYYICIKYCWLEYIMLFLFEKDMLHKNDTMFGVTIASMCTSVDNVDTT